MPVIKQISPPSTKWVTSLARHIPPPKKAVIIIGNMKVLIRTDENKKFDFLNRKGDYLADFSL